MNGMDSWEGPTVTHPWPQGVSSSVFRRLACAPDHPRATFEWREYHLRAHSPPSTCPEPRDAVDCLLRGLGPEDCPCGPPVLCSPRLPQR